MAKHNTQDERHSRETLLVTLATIALLMIGCDDKPGGMGDDLYDVRYLMQGDLLAPDEREQAERAISTYENGRTDLDPILIKVTLGRAVGSEQDDLDLCVFDEQADLRGVVVTEETRGPDGTVTVLREEYPIFAHYAVPGIASIQTVPVGIRDALQRKDEARWSGYTDLDFKRALNEAIRKETEEVGPMSSGDLVAATVTFWENTLPPIWISTPEPTVTKVIIQVYDKAGHKSNRAKLPYQGESRSPSE